MTPRLSKRVLKLALLSIGILFLGYFVLAAYSLRTFKLKFLQATASKQTQIGEISRNLDELNKALSPWPAILAFR